MDWIIIGGLLIIIVMQILLRPKQLNNNKEDLEKLLNEIQRSFDRIEKNFREDFRLNREESRLVAKDNREELAHSMNEFREAFERGIDSFNRLQKEKFAALDERQQRLVDNTEKRLEEIRVTVDEKLQKTLNDRIGQSFRLVTEQLESVQKGLGEMQTLAQDVGGLKRVLSNVKTRGNIGEIQLSMLLEQLLAPEQYEANVHTRKGSDAVVEFAVDINFSLNSEYLYSLSSVFSSLLVAFSFSLFVILSSSAIRTTFISLFSEYSLITPINSILSSLERSKSSKNNTNFFFTI